MNSKRIPFGLLASALVFIVGCGYRLTPFFTPVYKNPPGYSETYKKHLLGDPDEKSSARTNSRKDGLIQNQPSYLPPMDKVRDSHESLDSDSSSRNL